MHKWLVMLINSKISFRVFIRNTNLFISWKFCSFAGETPSCWLSKLRGSITVSHLSVISIRKCLSHVTSLNGNIFRVTGPLCGEFTDHRWIPSQSQWRGALMFSLICAWINGWVTNREACDLSRHRAHYDITVMTNIKLSNSCMLCLSACESPSFGHQNSAEVIRYHI